MFPKGRKRRSWDLCDVTQTHGLGINWLARYRASRHPAGNVCPRPLAARLRDRYGASPNPREFDDGRVTELVAYVQSESQRLMAELEANRSLDNAARSEADSSESPAVCRVALVSRNSTRQTAEVYWDYSADFRQVNAYCDKQGCDTILYALHTWDRRSPEPKTHDLIFGGLKDVHRILLETGELYSGRPRWAGNQAVEIWQRGQQTPRLAWQWFATTADMGSESVLVNGFLGDTVNRRFGDTLLVICGENGVISSGSPSHQQRFRWYFDQAGVQIILNPTHDYMKPYRGNDYFRTRMTVASQGNRTVVSVWNQGKGSTETAPWLLYRNGVDCSDRIQEPHISIPTRPDMRIGIVVRPMNPAKSGSSSARPASPPTIKAWDSPHSHAAPSPSWP